MAKTFDISSNIQDLGQVNIVEQLDEDILNGIGVKLVQGFYSDEDSRREWLTNVQKWVRLAMQMADQKTFPWPKASNVQYPLLATAALQFQARAYPALVPGPDLVKAYVTGSDPDGQAFQRAIRVGRHMSYQTIYEMDDWEEEMDKLCLVLPIVGTAFKKTYYDQLKGNNVSELVPAHQLVVNYWSKSLKQSARITQILHFNRNEVEERFRSGIWKKIDLSNPIPYSSFEKRDTRTDKENEPDLDYTTPDGFIESHTWWDLDNDGYREPWIITSHLTTKKVVRIVPRFSPDDVQKNGDEIVKIDPTEYFTKFGFIPNPDGSGIYDVGFGLLLGNINHSLDTLINQLFDSGTLNNLQAGFIGRGIRIKGGAVRFQPGEWKQADFTGDDIKKNIFPLPTKEPSDVLFKLFEALLTSGKELASVAEIMVGKLPGQNTPATTTQLSVDQSMKIFTAIYKRMYRSLSQEYEKLFRLNKLNLPDGKIYFQLNPAEEVPLPPEMQQQMQQGQQPGQPPDPRMQAQAKQMQQIIEKQDYSDNVLVRPNADPNIVSDGQRLTKAQGLMELLQLGTVNLQEATRQILEAQQQPNIEALLVPNPPRPDPKVQTEQIKQQGMQQQHQMDAQKMQMEMQLKEKETALEMQMKQMELRLKEVEMQLKAKEAHMDMQVKAQQAQQEVQLGAMQHHQAMTQSSQEHEQNMTLSKEEHNANMKMQKEKMSANNQQKVRGLSTNKEAR